MVKHTSELEEMAERVAKETARLQRELDITNADHIALWLEHNTVLDEPMNQCISWLACRIVEAHERAALQSSQPRSAADIDAEIANGSMWSVFQRKKPPIEQENTGEREL